MVLRAILFVSLYLEQMVFQDMAHRHDRCFMEGCQMETVVVYAWVFQRLNLWDFTQEVQW